MNRYLGIFIQFLDRISRRITLNIAVILSLALFILVLELLRSTLFKDTSLGIWVVMSLIVILIASFFFSRFIFNYIDRLQGKNMQRMHELETLSEVHQAVDEYHNINALLNRAMEKLIDITTADSAELFLVDEKNHELLHKLHGGSLIDIFNYEVLFSLQKWLAGEYARMNEYVVMHSPADIDEKPFFFLSDAGINSSVTIPLNSRSSTVGVICLFSQKPKHFKHSDVHLLLSVGEQIALAIEKARLYEKVQAIAVLEERERISAELHDGLAQVLSYVITKSQATRQLLQKMTEANDYLVELENIAQEVYTDTREAILGLRTAVSGDRSIISAIKEYVTRFNQMYNIKTELFICDHIIPSLSPQIELQVIRIIQEALSNVRKHADATYATIHVDADDNEITITVDDNGKGFVVNEVSGMEWAKFGLRNMKERSDSIHGNLFIESKPEIGTKVTLIIPLKSFQAAVEEGEEIESTNS